MSKKRKMQKWKGNWSAWLSVVCGISHYAALIFRVFLWEHHKETQLWLWRSWPRCRVHMYPKEVPSPDSALHKLREKTTDRCNEEIRETRNNNGTTYVVHSKWQSQYTCCLTTAKCFENNALNCIKLLGGQADHADAFSSSESMTLIAPLFECCAVTNPDNLFQCPLCNPKRRRKKIGVKICLCKNQWQDMHWLQQHEDFSLRA